MIIRVSHDEPGGMSTRELNGLFQGIEGKSSAPTSSNIIPGSISTGVTAMAAAKLIDKGRYRRYRFVQKENQ